MGNDYHRVTNQNVTYQSVIENFCISVNDFLDHGKRCLFIKCKNPVYCGHLLQTVNTNTYRFTDMFYHVTTPEQLLFLLRQQRNPNKRPSEYGQFLGFTFPNNIGIGVNPSGIINGIVNFFRRDIVSIAEQIRQCIRGIGGKLAIVLYISEDISDALKDVITDLCTTAPCDVKFVFVCSVVPGGNMEMLAREEFSEQDVLTLSYCAAQFNDAMPLLTEDQIISLLAATGENIDEMFLIYSKIVSDEGNLTELYLRRLIQNSLGKQFSPQEQKIIGAAAHLYQNFTKDELKNILGTADVEHSAEAIDRAVQSGCEKEIVSCSGAEYLFLSQYLKEVFAEMQSEISGRLHRAIANYLQRNDPFSYRLRRTHLQAAGDVEGVMNMIAMEFFNLLHFSKKPNSETYELFAHTFGESVKNNFLSIFDKIASNDLNGAYMDCAEAGSCENTVILREVKYLFALINWKRRDEQVFESIQESLDEIIGDEDSETEIVLFSNMLKLSVLSNSEGYNQKKSDETPVKLFDRIHKCLSWHLKLHPNIDEEYLLHVIYRKSAAAVQRSRALRYTQMSFSYFDERKELYPLEYFYAGVNYLALLLQSMTESFVKNADDCDMNDPLFFAKTVLDPIKDRVSVSDRIYFENNFLLARRFFSSDKITEAELTALYSDLEQVIPDTKILLLINIGSIYASQGKFDRARELWKEAEKLNIANDDYFIYIIEENRTVCDLCEGRCDEKRQRLSAPAIFVRDQEVYQYIRWRAKLLKKILSEQKQRSLQELESLFAEGFRKEYNESGLLFYSRPFLFSDVQFWSEN